MTDRYYLIEHGSPTHENIASAFQKRETAREARWDFMNREFPESKGKNSGWQIAYWESAFGGSSWAIMPPEGFTMPADWKYDKKSQTWSPRQSTKRGKELSREMKEDRYQMPSAGSIGHDIGCPSVFCGLSLCSIGIKVTPSKDFIVVLQTEHKKPPAFSERISDLEVESLMARISKKKPAARRRKTTVK